MNSDGPKRPKSVLVSLTSHRSEETSDAAKKKRV